MRLTDLKVLRDTIVQSPAVERVHRLLPTMIGRTVNALSNQPVEGLSPLRDSRLLPGGEPPLGAHLVTRRAFYSHHGIYVGSGRVIHYAGFARGMRRGPVEEVPLEHFAHGHAIRLRHDRRRFDCHEVVERARSRLGEDRYDILKNNCEHFCAWALRDEIRSRQVERLRFVPRVLHGCVDCLHLVIARAGWGQLHPATNTSLVEADL